MAVTIVEWPFVRLASFPLIKLARRCLVRFFVGLFIFAMRSLLGGSRVRFILNTQRGLVSCHHPDIYFDHIIIQCVQQCVKVDQKL